MEWLVSMSMTNNKSIQEKRYTFSVPESTDCDKMLRELDQLEFLYHSFYFNNDRGVRGDYDIGQTIDQFPFPDDMKGCRILDVGIGGGWFSLYFKSLGADVTAFDARGLCDMDVYGRYKAPRLEDEKKVPDRYDDNGEPVYHNRTSESFFILKKHLGLDISFRSGPIYKLNEIFEGEKFDIVFMGSILLHLRDPIGALMAARNICSGQLIADTNFDGKNKSELPMVMMPYTDFSKRAWWVPNVAGLKHWFLAAGFSDVNVDRTVDIRSDLPKEHISGKGRPANPDQLHRLCIAKV